MTVPGADLDMVRKLRALPAVGRKQVPGVGLVGVLLVVCGDDPLPLAAPEAPGRAGGRGCRLGTEPAGLPRPGSGRRFSTRHAGPVLLEHASQNAHLVEDFDRLAVWYDTLIRPFSGADLLTRRSGVMSGLPRLLIPVCSILGCGPGRELAPRRGRSVPEGEVVGADLAGGDDPVGPCRRAPAGDRDDCAFFQADAGGLPVLF